MSTATLHAVNAYVSEGYELVSIGYRSTECDMCMHMHNNMYMHNEMSERE